MNLTAIYQGFADANRLRIVRLLTQGPLGVKHLQTILGISQVRVSKHLSYLRERGIVEVERHQNWMIYRVPETPPIELAANLKCLAECVQQSDLFRADEQARAAVEDEVRRVTLLGRTAPGRVAKAAEAPPPADTHTTDGWRAGGDPDYID